MNMHYESAWEDARWRLFTEHDAAPLTTLLHTAYGALGEQGMNFTAVDQSEETTLERASAGSCWVLERDGELIASLTMSHPPAPDLTRLSHEARVPGRIWINQMAVRPDFQRRGIADWMFQQACTWARANEATSLGLDTAEPADHLRRLYERWGFQNRELIHWAGKNYDSMIMVRDL